MVKKNSREPLSLGQKTEVNVIDSGEGDVSEQVRVELSVSGDAVDGDGGGLRDPQCHVFVLKGKMICPCPRDAVGQKTPYFDHSHTCTSSRSGMAGTSSSSSESPPMPYADGGAI